MSTRPVEVKFRRRDSDGGVFDHGAGYDRASAKLDRLIDEHQAGIISDRKYAIGLTDLIDNRPTFIDAHVHLGTLAFMRLGPSHASDHFWTGYQIGLAALPVGYLDRIRWGELDNRPFLRAAHGVAACYRRENTPTGAIEIMERLLRWNPDDNQGIRFDIGSVYLRAGRPRTALSYLRDNAEFVSPLYYDLALLHFEQGDLVGAATELRRGFVTNGYVAEILNGCAYPTPLPIRHESSDRDLESARKYVDSYGKRWVDTHDALRFLRVVHSHSAVMRERASFLEFDEQLTRKATDLATRETRRAKFAGIDEALSSEAIDFFWPSPKPTPRPIPKRRGVDMSALLGG